MTTTLSLVHSKPAVTAPALSTATRIRSNIAAALRGAELVVRRPIHGFTEPKAQLFAALAQARAGTPLELLALPGKAGLAMQKEIEAGADPRRLPATLLGHAAQSLYKTAAMDVPGVKEFIRRWEALSAQQSDIGRLFPSYFDDHAVQEMSSLLTLLQSKSVDIAVALQKAAPKRLG